MSEKEYVFGLDIGTRNVVGTVGYMQGEVFHVLAQVMREHKSRSMIDGQIHNIEMVSGVVAEVKEELEEITSQELKNVCIAAAGRVLKTVTAHVQYEYEEETVVTGEDLYTLDLLGVDKAHSELTNKNKDFKFYCVGYTVMKYYLNGEDFTSLEGHKAEKIEEDIIVTFLPEDVVDGLYSAVERVGLNVANLTLEPIAAINVAIPETFRMLNIALVDVGAGTSDICITNDGAIIAYGMIPYAGDELTEALVKGYLVDFANAEKLKKDATESDNVTYEDIMGLTHSTTSKEVWSTCEDVIENITADIAEKIKELNGGKSVAAVFVVGGGGKAKGFCEKISNKLDLIEERVALRGEDVMRNIEFDFPETKKDSLLVTPIGICLNYFKQRNSFIMIRFNGEILKLYDNGCLKIMDAALAAGFSTEELFPRRGKEIHFTVNGVKRMERGEAGESARVYMNNRAVGLNDNLLPNSEIKIEGSTKGSSASLRIGSLEEFSDTGYVNFTVNEKKIRAPRFVEVNGKLATADYEISDGDDIETRPFYTIRQLAEFMDVVINENYEILVNNRPADMDSIIYENFTVEWTIDKLAQIIPDTDGGEPTDKENETDLSGLSDYAREEIEEANRKRLADRERRAGIRDKIFDKISDEGDGKPTEITVTVNDTEIRLSGKRE